MAPLRAPLLTVPAPAPVEPKAAVADANADARAQAYNERLRKTLQALMGAGDGEDDKFPRVLVEKIDLGGGEGDLVFEIDLGYDGDHDDEDSQLSILEALQAAGIDVREKESKEKKKGARRDEL